MKKVSCHCGKVKLQIKVDDLGKLQRCNCSICKKKGSIMAAVDLNNLQIDGASGAPWGVAQGDYLHLVGTSGAEYHARVVRVVSPDTSGLSSNAPKNDCVGRRERSLEADHIPSLRAA